MKTIQQLFEEQVKKTPDAIALVSNDKTLSYQELNEHANYEAKRLTTFGLTPEKVVAVCFDPTQHISTIDIILAYLAVFKAGGAYVPIDTSYPAERINSILKDVSPHILLGPLTAISKLPSHTYSIIPLANKKEKTNPPAIATANNLAYIMYSSSSEGNPKGVQVEQAGLVNCIEEHILRLSLSSQDKVIQYASPNFDASFIEIFMTLCAGATLYLINNRKDISALTKQMQTQEITTTIFPPAILQEGLLSPADLPQLKNIIIAGDYISPAIIRRWLPLDNGTQRLIFNGYGLTETSICTTLNRITINNLFENQTSIGLPITNSAILILDNNLKPVAQGVEGEIYIAGLNLARGYTNPSLTVQYFISPPEEVRNYLNKLNIPAEKILKTGDRGYQLQNGEYICLGRASREVKFHSKKINLDAIETTLTQLPAVKHAAVIVQEPNSEMKSIVIYVVKQFQNLDVATIRKHLDSKFSEEEVPSKIVFIDNMPFSESGKIDRKSLSHQLVQTSKISTNFVPADSDLQKEIQQIFAKLLNIQDKQSLSIHDNFIDCGGDSVKRMQLLKTIQNDYIRSITMQNIEDHLTIASLATLVRIYSNDNPFNLEENNDDVYNQSPSFYCFHDITGEINPQLYKDLAQILPYINFYGLKAYNGDLGQCTSIEEMAEYYCCTILDMNPNGEYNFIGYSFGGTIAAVVAEKLQARGKRVANLFILDAPSPLYYASLQPHQHADQVLNSFHHLVNYFSAQDPNLLKFPNSNFSEIYNYTSRTEQVEFIFKCLNLEKVSDSIKASLSISRNHMLQMAKYTNQTTIKLSSTNIVLFYTLDSFKKPSDYGWEPYSDILDEIRITSNHFTIMSDEKALNKWNNYIGGLFNENLSQIESTIGSQSDYSIPIADIPEHILHIVEHLCESTIEKLAAKQNKMLAEMLNNLYPIVPYGIYPAIAARSPSPPAPLPPINELIQDNRTISTSNSGRQPSRPPSPCTEFFSTPHHIHLFLPPPTPSKRHRTSSEDENESKRMKGLPERENPYSQRCCK